MRKYVFLFVFMGLMPMASQAQDDLYFSKDDIKSTKSVVENIVSDYPGCDRDVDEYNRRGKLSSYYQKTGVDSLGNDIIEFRMGNGMYPDEIADTIYPGSATYYEDDDFAYSRRLSRFDCWYGWYNPWYYGYYSPWRWHYGWYDPWYDGYWGYGYWGWNRWHYGWGYGWGYPYYHPWGGTLVSYRSGHTGTLGYYDRHNSRPGSSLGTGNRGTNTWNKYNTGNVTRRGNTGFGTRRNTNTTRTYDNNRYDNNRYDNTQRNNSSFGTSRGSSFGGGGSFGGNRGGSFGGSRGGGGGHVGGRR